MSLSVHTVLALDSENPSGADNQQETATLGGILRDCTWGSAIPLEEQSGKDTVRPPWRHGELGRNDLARLIEVVMR